MTVSGRHEIKGKGNDIANIWGSCDGLLYMYVGERHYMNNPITNKRSPIPPPQCKSVLSDYTVGFAYSSKNDDYKIVCIPCSPRTNLSVEVYSSKTNLWKFVQCTEYECSKRNGVLVSGHLHWMAVHDRVSTRYDHHGGPDDDIIAFDVSNDTIKLVDKPESFLYVKEEYFLSVGDLGGRLCLLCNKFGTQCMDIWVMEDYGVRRSWTKRLSTENLWYMNKNNRKCYPKFLYLTRSSTNGVILFEVSKSKFIIYNPKYRRIEVLNVDGIPKGWSQSVTYTASLISLDTVLTSS